jgi:V8-like Glu-specific endopeptidase
MKKIILLLLLVGLFSINDLSAQKSYGGLPYSLNPKLKNVSNKNEKLSDVIPLKEMPKIKQSDIDLIKEKNKYGLEKFQFAYSFDVFLDIKQESVIDSLENGVLYRLSIKSQGAKSLNIIFGNYQVPKGAKLFLYNENYNSIIGAFTSNNNKKSKKLPTHPVSGEILTIEYFEPYFAQTKGILTIGKVSHDIYGIEDGGFGRSGDCQVDINCNEGNDWQDEKRAVCKIIINGSGLCTGTLMNNTSFDGTPLFLTANHCICNQNDAENSVYIFNYESPSCDGGDGSVSQQISGADLRATNTQSDFSLLELSQSPISTYNPYYAGWDRTNIQGNGGVGIHHPKGDVKKISTHNIVPVNSDCMDFTEDFGCGAEFYSNENFWRINWISTANGHSITEGGSSGSPLFNDDSRVIGQLFGAGSCNNPNCDSPEDDIANYGKIFTSWNNGANEDEHLQGWLDPNNSGVDFLNGAGICNEGVELNLNLTDDVLSGESLTFRAVNSIEATNTINSGATVIYEAGEKITLYTDFKVESGSIFTARISNNNCVVGCYPIDLVAWTSYVVSGSDLCFNITNAEHYSISIYSLSGHLVYSNSGNIIGTHACLWNTINVATGFYLATVSFSNNCDEISNSYKLFVTSSSTKSAVISEQTEVATEILEEETGHLTKQFEVKVYPNPNKGSFTVEIFRTENKPYTLEICNSNGILIYKVEHLQTNKLLINQIPMSDGLYYLRIKCGANISTEKIIVNKKQKP